MVWRPANQEGLRKTKVYQELHLRNEKAQQLETLLRNMIDNRYEIKLQFQDHARLFSIYWIQWDSPNPSNDEPLGPGGITGAEKRHVWPFELSQVLIWTRFKSTKSRPTANGRRICVERLDSKNTKPQTPHLIYALWATFLSPLTHTKPPRSIDDPLWAPASVIRITVPWNRE